MHDTVVVHERFRGPPDSANGGYTCGLLARWINGSAEVTLRAPPPLGIPLHVERSDEGMSLLDGEGKLIAEAKAASVAVDVPKAIPVGSAREAALRYPWRDRHPYPTCFVCGPERDRGDGLEIFPGPVEGESVYAAPPGTGGCARRRARGCQRGVRLGGA